MAGLIVCIYMHVRVLIPGFKVHIQCTMYEALLFIEVSHATVYAKKNFRVSNGFHKYNAFCTFRPNLKRLSSIVAEIWLFL